MKQALSSPDRAIFKRKKGIAIDKLTLTDFRNYSSLRLELGSSDAPAIVLVGQNGAGKTNLLEALSYLIPGRGLRGCALPEMARLEGQGGWAVAVEGHGLAGAVSVGTGLGADSRICSAGDSVSGEFEEPSKRRQVRINGSTVAGLSALEEHFAISWLTPLMDRLFIDSASGRRRFFDRLVASLHPGHTRSLNAYEKAMRERLKLLVEQSNADKAWLSALEERMAEHGVAVAAARLDVLARLQGEIDKAGTEPFPVVDLALEGQVEEYLVGQSAIGTEEAFAGWLASARSDDARSGRTHVGVHKTDLIAHHRKKSMPAALCSTGEQKALLAGLILAEARLTEKVTGFSPILLLDEVTAHFDGTHREALFHALLELGSQFWVTGTDVSLFEPLRPHGVFLTVENGGIRPEVV